MNSRLVKCTVGLQKVWETMSKGICLTINFFLLQLYWRRRWFYGCSVEHFCDCGLLIVWLVFTLFYLLAILRCVRRLQQHRHQVVPCKNANIKYCCLKKCKILNYEYIQHVTLAVLWPVYRAQSNLSIVYFC